ELKPILDSTFGALPARAAPIEVAESKPAAPGSVIVVDRAMPQSVVLFGSNGIKRHDPDFYAAYLLNHILGGGGFTSRLMQEVREKRGLAYSVDTSLYTLDHAAVVQGAVGTKNASVAETMSLIRQEWKRMREEGPTNDELAEAKLFLTGSYALRFSSTIAIANSLVGVQLENVAPDNRAKRNRYTAAGPRADVRRVAKRLLDPDSLPCVMVGGPEGVPGPQAAPEGVF